MKGEIVKKYRLFTASLFLATFLLALTAGDSVAQVLKQPNQVSKQQITGQDGSAKLAQCEKAVKSCKDVKVGKTWGEMRKSCRPFKSCKKDCRKSKRSCKRDARSTKRDCKKACKRKSGRAKRRCKRACRKNFRGSKKDCRGEKRDCKHECRNHYKGPCRSARRAFWKSLPRTGKCVIDGAGCIGAVIGETPNE